MSYTIADAYSGSDGSSDLYIMKESLTSGLLMGCPLPHDSPYKDQLDKALLDIFTVSDVIYI